MLKVKNIIFLLIGILFLILCFLIKFDYEVQMGDFNTVVVPNINDKIIIEKRFVSMYDELETIGIKFATYLKNNNTGELNITVVNENSHEEIYNNDIDISKIQDNSFYYIHLLPQHHAKNVSYKITIYGKEIPLETQLGIWGYESDENKLQVNESSTSADIGMVLYIKKCNYLLLLYVAIYFIVYALIKILRNN